MAEELRWHMLAGTTPDTDTGDDADAQFENSADKICHIREIQISCRLKTATCDEYANVEVSKAPGGDQMAVNGSNFYTLPVRLVAPPAGATPVDGGVFYNGVRKYAKGQVTLEPNESLFVNTLKSAGGHLEYTFEIGFHY